MLTDFQKYIAQHKLLVTGQKVLVGVSGGPDSVALFHLLYRCGYQPAIAHANFGLRGEESDADEEFVKILANEYHVPLFVKKFDTIQYQANQKISAQMAARDLRFQWFYSLAEQNGYEAIALGHHMDDQTETFFINLLRGSGLRGLKAMEPKNDLLIRPLLFANQHDILTYIGNNNLSYRTDSSNKSNKYLRNQIRNQIIPLLCEIDPNANAGIKKSIELLSLNFNLYNELVTHALQTVCTKQNNLIVIDKKALLRFNNWHTVLWEILSTFGFDSQLMPSITKSINNEPGKKFYSQTHRMVIDRENLEIIGLEHISSEEINIVTDMALFTKAGFQLKFDRLIRTSDFNPDTDPDLAFTDHDQIQFPLVVRTWQKGDRFFPLGLAGSKLVSDYFSDHKFSLSQKEQARLLCNANGDIIWIIGHRLDDRYSIKTTTKNILKINCKRI